MQARATGEGQFVDVSLLGALSAMVAMEPFDVLARLGQPYRTGNFMARLAPFGIFETSDGYMAVCAPVNNFVEGLFAAMGRPELLQDARFSSRDARVTNHEVLHSLVGDWVRTMTTEQAAELLAEHGVPSGAVLEPGEAKRHPDRLARGETVPLEHPVYGDAGEALYCSGLPIRMSGSFVGYDQPAPELGAGNNEIYGGLLGYDAEKLAALSQKKVI
jgi:crotonobetainyl-CoA:carnitine CoA-transferase CaiB-like acyl-CoA transferase